MKMIFAVLMLFAGLNAPFANAEGGFDGTSPKRADGAGGNQSGNSYVQPVASGGGIGTIVMGGADGT